ncbi:hypothetical protein WICPIJ_003152 [Wickerhamomyces pijperi]|uniref:Uncharacterized protein n=1 Tax=Wickerhamomyces pijperi TaxID=599730 RepID=A0A9P8TP53_WICPI|nr:hypothetical protein WICPIJ_003152 [Wickerhamomyces pijperi]
MALLEEPKILEIVSGETNFMNLSWSCCNNLKKATKIICNSSWLATMASSFSSTWANMSFWSKKYSTKEETCGVKETILASAAKTMEPLIVLLWMELDLAYSSSMVWLEIHLEMKSK